ncbi:hypothetical protein [Magnetovibrio sp.]|uniref:hypothetical protein n=1 Tax=Magnetovibrio sp. TaxID=2024836 RepID=UPI002F9286A9
MLKLIWNGARITWREFTTKSRLLLAAFMIGFVALSASLGWLVGWLFWQTHVGTCWGAGVGGLIDVVFLGLLVWGTIAWDRDAEGRTMLGEYKRGRM